MMEEKTKSKGRPSDWTVWFRTILFAVLLASTIMYICGIALFKIVEISSTFPTPFYPTRTPTTIPISLWDFQATIEREATGQVLREIQGYHTPTPTAEAGQ